MRMGAGLMSPRRGGAGDMLRWGGAGLRLRAAGDATSMVAPRLSGAREGGGGGSAVFWSDARRSSLAGAGGGGRGAEPTEARPGTEGARAAALPTGLEGGGVRLVV